MGEDLDKRKNLKKWNHNIHYHNMILNNLSNDKCIALDIGSGDGDFAEKLSKYYEKTVCLEPDLKSYEYAKNKYSINNKITHENNTLDDYTPNKKFDFITCIASIHHMDFEKSLIKIKNLLKDNGKLIILGLYKEKFLIDYLYSLIACIPNKVRCMINREDNNSSLKIKLKPANMNYKEIEEISNKILGDCKIRRHFYWRYSIIYKK